MLFNSFEFLLFLPIVFLLYWFVFKPRRWQNLLIVLASYVFYGWWDWRFLLLIAFTSILSFVSGLLIERFEGRRNCQKSVSAINIVINLGILVAFKYFNFFVENLAAVFSAFGWKLDWATVNIILPVGISFYTFQALSYSIDVYQKKIPATHHTVEFFAYISFFPQLVAGPIERATHLLPQFQRSRRFDYGRAVDGCRQMLWGFFKKMVIADNCASIVDETWGSYVALPGVALIILGILFTFQIYCDFSGYSDIAIGCARLFGINLSRNFHFPYFSCSIPEFWRRWHISLMSWLRDYVYIPLGGSRRGKMRTVVNILTVWIISGLWHGANWTFVCWGLFHSVILIFYHLLGINTKVRGTPVIGHILPTVKTLFKMLLTFSLVVVGWIIFRSESMTQAIDFFHSFITNDFYDPSRIQGRLVLLYCLLPIFAEWLQRDKQHAFQLSATKGLFRSRLARWSLYLIVFFCIILFRCGQSDFLYFQF